MTQRLAIRLAVIFGLLAGSCSGAPSDEGDGSAAVGAVATTITTASTSNLPSDGERSVLRIDQTGTAAPTAQTATTQTATSEISTTETSATETTTTETTVPGTSATEITTTETTATETAATETTVKQTTVVSAGAGYFATLGVGQALPSGSDCKAQVNAGSNGQEVRQGNAAANARTVSVSVQVDGPDDSWNSANASRITGNFTGTTEDILRWGACKWGFDEDITKARAVTESSWNIDTEGDRTDNAGLCQTMGLGVPCNQSYGLLQVKGSVHDGTYPESKQATAFGVDYAMAWLRACYDGAMGWLGSSYSAGDEWGCIGAWFSGLWKDGGANDYISVVRGHLNDRTWAQY